MNTNLDHEGTKDIRQELIRGCYILIAAVIGASGVIVAALITTGGVQLTASRAPALPVAVLASTSTPQPTSTPYATFTPFVSPPTVQNAEVQQPTQPAPNTSSFTQDDINTLLGTGNWTCLNGSPNGISIKSVPPNLMVRFPLFRVDKGDTMYFVGQSVPSGGVATGWLQSSLPNNKCSTAQIAISKSDIDSLLGAGNWYCLNNSPNGVIVRNVPNSFTVRPPLQAVDKLEVRYLFGEAVPAGGPATAWMQNEFARDLCP